MYKRQGLLGSNKSTEDKIQLFPNECFDLVEDIQKQILDKTGKHVEVMVYGDGAFKDPQGKIWEQMCIRDRSKSNSSVDYAMLEYCIREDLKMKKSRMMAVLDPCLLYTSRCV